MSDVTVVLVHGAFAESASWSGVISRLRAAEYRRALVYIAGFAPAEGESVGDLQRPNAGSTLADTLFAVPLADGTNDLFIETDVFHEQFAADLPAEDAALLAATQRPVRDVVLTEASGTPARQSVPSWFLLGGADRNIPFESQRFMAERAGAKSIVEIADASDAVPVSRPAEVAEPILAAVAADGHSLAPTAREKRQGVTQRIS